MDNQNQHKHAHTSSGHESHGVHVCHKCGWPFPNPHPSAKHRRAHKKVCGNVEGYKLVGDFEGSVHSNVSDDEHLCDEDHKTPSPKVLEASSSEKGSGGAMELPSRSEDEVFSDAATVFVDGRIGAGTRGLEDDGESAIDVEKVLKKESDAIPSAEFGPVAEAVKPSGGTTNSSQVQHSETPESTSNRLENAPEFPGLSSGSTVSSDSNSQTNNSALLLDGDRNASADDSNPLKSEMQKDALVESEMTKAVDDVFVGSSTLAQKGTHVEGDKETCSDNKSLDTKISPGEVACETAEAVEPLSPLLKDGTVHSKIPITDVCHEFEFDEHKNVVIVTADIEEGISDTNSDNLIRKGEVDANVHELSVPDDIHEVDNPKIMLEDFKVHKAMDLSKSSTIECDKVDETTDYVIEESGHSSQTKGTAISASSSHSFVKDISVEEEADQSQTKVKINENQGSDEVGAPRDVSNSTSVSGSAGMVLEIHLLGENDEQKTVNFGLSGDDNSKRAVESDYMENPVTVPEFTSSASEIQVNPVTRSQEEDDAGCTKKLDMKDDTIGDVCDAAANHVKDEIGVDNDGPAKENFVGDAIVTPESAKKFSESKVDQETELHDSGNYEKVEIEKDNINGEACDAAIGHVKDETGVDNRGCPTVESWADNAIVTSESANNKVTEPPVNPAANLQEGTYSSAHEKGIVERCIGHGTEIKEDLLMQQNTLPQSASHLHESQTIAEDVVFGSVEKLQETACTDLGSALDSRSVVVNMVSGAQLGEDKPSGNKEVTPINSVDNHVKEPTLSPLDDKSCLQNSTATEQNSAREFDAASGLGSESLQGESDRQQLGGSLNDISVDSSSQTDSLENNWGSVSVLSVQSDAQLDAEIVPPTESREVKGEKASSKQSKASFKVQHSNKSDMFEPPSFMTLVETRGENGQTSNTSEIKTSENPQQPNSSSLQAAWFPSITHVVNESQGRKKNEEIIAKVTNWSTGKQHTPLKSLLGEASLETRAKSPKRKENPAPAPQKDDKPAATVNSNLAPESPSGQHAVKEIGKEWDSPARYPTEIKREKRKPKGRPYWAQFMCCSSVH